MLARTRRRGSPFWRDWLRTLGQSDEPPPPRRNVERIAGRGPALGRVTRISTVAHDAGAWSQIGVLTDPVLGVPYGAMRELHRESEAERFGINRLAGEVRPVLPAPVGSGRLAQAGGLVFGDGPIANRLVDRDDFTLTLEKVPCDLPSDLNHGRNDYAPSRPDETFSRSGILVCLNE